MGAVKMMKGDSTSMMGLTSGCIVSMSILLAKTATANSIGMAKMVRERSGTSFRFHSSKMPHSRLTVTFSSATANTISVTRL